MVWYSMKQFFLLVTRKSTLHLIYFMHTLLLQSLHLYFGSLCSGKRPTQSKRVVSNTFLAASLSMLHQTLVVISELRRISGRPATFS